MNAPQPGELYWADIEPGKERGPVIVVSRAELNRGKHVVVVTLTSTNFEQRCSLPNAVPFKAGQYGLTKDCVAQCESITVIERADLGSQPFSQLTDEDWRNVVRAIGNVICADCEPS